MDGFTASTSAMCQQRSIPLLPTKNNCAGLKAAAILVALMCDWHDRQFRKLMHNRVATVHAKSVARIPQACHRVCVTSCSSQAVILETSSA